LVSIKIPSVSQQGAGQACEIRAAAVTTPGLGGKKPAVAHSRRSEVFAFSFRRERTFL
jgi:hypothetical protein